MHATLRRLGRRARRLPARLVLSAAAFGQAGAARAVSLGDMTDAAAADLETVPTLIAVICWVLGITLVVMGIMRVKKSMEMPQQASVAAGIAAILIGVALILAPTIINSVAETFGIGTGSISAPRF